MRSKRADILQNKSWDINHPKLQKLLKEYISWNNDAEGYIDSSEEELKQDIINCLNSYTIDGYNLAKHLEDYCHIQPDARLVEILDNVGYIKRSIITENLANWVKSEKLALPDNILGRKVSAKQDYQSFDNYFIVATKPETYEVIINKDRNVSVGNVVAFENVTFID